MKLKSIYLNQTAQEVSRSLQELDTQAKRTNFLFLLKQELILIRKNSIEYRKHPEMMSIPTMQDKVYTP